MLVAKKVRMEIIETLIEFGAKSGCLLGVLVFLMAYGYTGPWFENDEEEKTCIKCSKNIYPFRASRIKDPYSYPREKLPVSLEIYKKYRYTYAEYSNYVDDYRGCFEVASKYSTFKHVQLFGYYADIPYKYIEYRYGIYKYKYRKVVPKHDSNITSKKWKKMKKEWRERVVIGTIYSQINEQNN